MTANPYESPEMPGTPPPPSWNLSKYLFRVLLVVGIGALLYALLIPAGRRGAREAARRAQCSNNLRQIGLALQNYHATYGCLPPAYTINAAGTPLHSWRTVILPFIEQKQLYDQIDLSKPWDDPVNQAVHESSPRVYQCPSGNTARRQTSYLAIVSPGGCFQPTKGRKIADITDSKNLTLMVIEVPDEHAVHWMSPSDADEALILKSIATARPTHPTGAQAVTVDGVVHLLRRNTDPAALRALISIDGNDNDIAESGL